MRHPERSSTASDPTFEHAEALKELAEERNRSRTTLRDKEGILKDGPEGGEEDPRLQSEKVYTEALRDQVADEAIKFIEDAPSGERPTQREVLSFVRDRILDAQLERMQAEIDARANPETKWGKLKGKFIETWRKYPKTRAVIGVGLVVASGGFAAAGLGGIAIGAAGVRAAMAGVGGYMGAKGAQEAGGAFMERRRGGIFKAIGKEGDKAPLTLEEALAMDSDERTRRMTALLSAGILESKGPDSENGTDRVTFHALREAERQDIQEALEKKSERYRGNNLVLGASKVLEERVNQQLGAERDRLIHDKKVNRRRTAIAGVVGVAVAASSLFHNMDNADSVRNIKGFAAPDIGATDQSPGELHRAVDNEWASTDIGEIYTPSDVIMDQVNGDEMQIDAVSKHLENIQEYKDLDGATQGKILSELGASKEISVVTNPDGVKEWRIPKSTLQEAINRHQ